MKKNILSKILTLGAVATPILVGTTLVTTSSNINLNKNTLTIANRISNDTLSVPENGIIDLVFVSNLIETKKIDTSWDGSLVEADFESAISVADGAFSSQSDVTSLTLPKSVRLINSNAFNGASTLTTISALGVRNIDDGAFAGANAIIPSGIKLTESENIKPTEANATKWGTQLDKLDIKTPIAPIMPENNVINSQFVDDLITYKVDTIVDWEGVLIIDDFTNAVGVANNAFRNKSTLTSITLPDTVLTIGSDAFSGMTGITGLEGSKINLTYSENIKPGNAQFWGIDVAKLNITGSPEMPLIPEDGIITSNFVNLLIEFKNSLLPTGSPWDGVLVDSYFTNAISVADAAFQGNIEIKSITLPTSVLKIGDNAFSGATNLTTISALGATSIGADAFAGTTGIIPSGIKLTESANINVDQAATWGIEPDKLDITPAVVTPPTVPTDGIITTAFVTELIAYKNSQATVENPWDGSILENDLVNAISVADAAFQGNIEIKSITLPTSVLKIGLDAFNGAANLTTISALGATDIAPRAFAGENAIIPSGIKLTESTNIDVDQASVWGTTADKLDITPAVVTPPTVPEDGIITAAFITELIAYKNSQATVENPWDGSILENDLVNAISVADAAFQGNNDIKSITLPSIVLTIGDNAFNGAANLTTISALGATSIGTNAFAGANAIIPSGIKLTESANINVDQAATWGIEPDKLDITPAVVTPPTVPTDGIITTAFVTELIAYKNSQATVENPWDGSILENDLVNAISVADAAFQGNNDIKSITLPSIVLTIGDNAFNGAANLTTISALGATSIGTNAFAGANAIIPSGIKLTESANINVDQAATWGIEPDKLDITPAVVTPPTVPTDGIITTAFVTELIAYKNSQATVDNPWDGSLLASDFTTATSIANGAFQGNIEIKSITLPTSVLKIGLDAFNAANALTTISALGATSIGANAFAGTAGIIPSGIKLTGSANINIEQATAWGTTSERLDITPYVPTPPSDDQNMIYIIIGAIIGSLLLIGGIVGGVLFYRKKVNESDSSKNKSKDKDSKDKKEKESKKDKDSKDKKSKKEKDSKDKKEKDYKDKKEKESKKDKDSKDKKEKESKKDKDSKDKKDKESKKEKDSKDKKEKESKKDKKDKDSEDKTEKESRKDKDLKDDLETKSIDNDENNESTVEFNDEESSQEIDEVNDKESNNN